MTIQTYIAVVDAEGRLEAEASEDVVPWWSFSKTLITIAALKLAESGVLALDDQVGRYPFTVRQLMRHTAGVGDYGAMPDYHSAVAGDGEPWSDDQVFARVPPTRLQFPPGTAWAYSNVGFLMLRRIVERCFGAPLDHVLTSLIFGPLDIGNVRVASTRAEMAGLSLPPPHPHHPDWAFHGFVIGPVCNAALVLHRMLEGDFLRADSRAALFDRQALGGALPGRPWATIGYGTGTMMPTLARGPATIELVGHSAGGPGSSGAVYQVMRGAPMCTVAVFSAAASEGVAEAVIAAHVLDACD